MKEPENHTLRFLREIREEVSKVDKLDAKIERLRSELAAEIRGLRKYIVGENIVGRYAAANVEERLASLEKRMAAVEDQR